MRHTVGVGLLLLAAAVTLVTAQSTGRVVTLDPALASLVPESATIEKVAGGLGFAEGPVWVRGALLYSDIPGNAIHRLSGGQDTVFRTPIYERTDFKPGFHIGSNGLTVDRQGRLIICEHGNRRVTRLDASGQLTVLADKYDGKRLNSPNDAVVRSDGSVYFTDPPYGLPGQDSDPAKEVPFSGVYRIAPDGAIHLLTNELTRPNGLAFSPDERYLYVANSDAARRLWMRYDVKPDGSLGAGTVFYDLATAPERGIPDGLKLDAAGNVFGTGPAGVWIISAAGKALGRIEPPEVPANVAWGEDGKMLYMTARTSVYRIRLNTGGKLP